MRPRGYVGTAAHGRTASYRYYTCWSRVRYGTNAGCDIHRFNADAIEQAITTALLDFYTHRGDLIEQAVTEFQAQHTTANSASATSFAAVAASSGSSLLSRYGLCAVNR